MFHVEHPSPPPGPAYSRPRWPGGPGICGPAPVHIGYFAQEHTELHGAWTVLDEIMNAFSYGEDEARSAFRALPFSWR
mgnify:CR=1 FL=1